MGDYSEDTQNGIYLQQLSNIAGIYLPFVMQYLIILEYKDLQEQEKQPFLVKSLIVSRIDTCLFQECDNGLYMEGAAFGTDTTISTSVSVRNCYANNCGNNSGLWIYINNCSYIQFLNCACDVSNTTQLYGYYISSSSPVSLDTCSVEIDDSSSLLGAMYAISSSEGNIKKLLWL